MLLGRRAEFDAIDGLLDDVRAGHGGALVLRGEAGVGKSSLLGYARDHAADMRVLKVLGIESESELPFAALHQLLLPCLKSTEQLPTAQAGAIRAALGISDGHSDRFLVGLGTLGLLSEIASEKPVLCLVDDSQWLDRESAGALLFAARRLVAEGVGILFATRDSPDFGSDLSSIWIAPLSESDARVLLADRHPGLDSAAQDRVIEAAAGNPLALIEFPARLGTFAGSPDSAASAIERAYLHRLSDLPPQTRKVLLIAAGAETGELAWIARAAALLGLEINAVAPAEEAEVITVDAGTLRFRHPLIRSAVYTSAPSSERRRVHEALATTLDDEQEDRRAWHRAAAALGPDENLAAELERAAVRASRRTGLGAASVALERAASLSPREDARARRLVAAAEAAWQAGDVRRSQELLGQAHPLDDPLLRAERARLQGVISAQAGRPGDATLLLTDAASELAAIFPQRSLQLAALAAETAWFAGDSTNLSRLADMVMSLEGEGTEESRFELAYIEGLSALFRPEAHHAFGPLSEATGSSSAISESRMLSWAGDCADLIGDAVRAYELHAQAVARAREERAIGDLVHGLYVLARSELELGRLSAATADATEGLQLGREMHEPGVAAHLAAVLARISALRGELEASRVLAAEALEQAIPNGLSLATSEASLGLAELDLALGNPADALERLEPLTTLSGHPAYRVKVVPTIVEAAVRAGQPARATEPFAAAAAWAEHTKGPKLVAQVARCRALLARPQSAEGDFEEALRLHAECRIPLDLARTELSYGEFLRRAKRRREARTHLRMAVELFEAVGAPVLANRAAAELRATGETARRRDPSTREDLTPQELQIARLVAGGASNRDVAAQLFLSPKTIEYHLRKVFQKLGIAARTDLSRIELEEDLAAPG